MVESKIKSEKMSLDEAINHAEWKASDLEVEARHIDGVPPVIRSELRRSAENWSQLEEWLKELKALRKEMEQTRLENEVLKAEKSLLLKWIEIVTTDVYNWIPVEELPEEYGRYLVCFKQGIGIPCRVDICNYGEDCGTFDEEPHLFLDYEKYVALMDDEVEAWMKLPDPCEE